MNDFLDAAYFLRKESAKNPTVELRERFPESKESDIKEALSRARALVKAACDWADQYRGPNNDGRGTATIDLRKECVGFSERVYKDAESWGLYLTK